MVSGILGFRLSLVQKVRAPHVAGVWAAGFAIHKIISGYYYANMVVEVMAERQPKDSGKEDWLAVTAKLKKGSIGSLRELHALVRVTPEGAAPFTKELKGYRRLAVCDTVKPARFKKDMPEDASDKAVRLPPGDEAHFACYCHVPSNAPCLIELALLTHERGWLGRGQWLASTVSLPKARLGG